MLVHAIPSNVSYDFAADVRAGLTRSGQKELPSKYLYDEVGSALFEVICRLPQYGLTRADERLLRRHADEIVDRLVIPLVEKAVPEWQATLDALLSLPEIDGPVGYAGMTAIGIRLAVVEPRISAVNFFAQGFVPGALREEARQVTIPLQVLLQWDDEGNDRQLALDLFDAFGSREKTLQANMGGHTGVPQFAGEDAARFFARHLS